MSPRPCTVPASGRRLIGGLLRGQCKRRTTTLCAWNEREIMLNVNRNWKIKTRNPLFQTNRKEGKTLRKGKRESVAKERERTRPWELAEAPFRRGERRPLRADGMCLGTSRMRRESRARSWRRRGAGWSPDTWGSGETLSTLQVWNSWSDEFLPQASENDAGAVSRRLTSDERQRRENDGKGIPEKSLPDGQSPRYGESQKVGWQRPGVKRHFAYWLLLWSRLTRNDILHLYP